MIGFLLSPLLEELILGAVFAQNSHVALRLAAPLGRIR